MPPIPARDAWGVSGAGAAAGSSGDFSTGAATGGSSLLSAAGGGVATAGDAARSGMGTINHTLLTLAALHAASAVDAVFSDAKSPPMRYARASWTSARLIAALGTS